MSVTVRTSFGFGQNLDNVRVYGIDSTGNIVEWSYTVNEGWKGPGKLPAKADSGSDITVVSSGDWTNLRIRLYYTFENRIRELTYNQGSGKGWTTGAVLP